MSQIFRVERTKNYTVMSNQYFKNKSLSLKAKGLFLMLSLPDDWNYNMYGLFTDTEYIIREIPLGQEND